VRLVLVVLLLLSWETFAQVNYFPTTGSAICPANYARGLVWTSSLVQCVNTELTPSTQPPVRDGAAGAWRVTATASCPVQTTNLVSVTVYYANGVNGTIAAACGYSGGSVSVGSGAVDSSPVDPHINRRYGVTSCLSSHRFAVWIRPTEVLCINQDSTTTQGPVDATTSGAYRIDYNAMCPVKLSPLTETRISMTAGQPVALCRYQDGSSVAGTEVSFIAEVSALTTARLSLLLANIGMWLAGLTVGWKLSIRPPLEVLT